jgi:hypothetical protein
VQMIEEALNWHPCATEHRPPNRAASHSTNWDDWRWRAELAGCSIKMSIDQLYHEYPEFGNLGRRKPIALTQQSIASVLCSQ